MKRIFFFGLFTTNHDFPTNKIVTSKLFFALYNLYRYQERLSFYRFFLHYFRNILNCYFLLIAILESIPVISPNYNPASAWIPLLLMMGLGMVHEFYEDRERKSFDQNTNQNKCTAYRQGKWITINWENVVVGELLLMWDDEIAPADLIIMESGFEGGKCHVDTSKLDGQKHLKIKFCHPSTIGCFRKEDQICRIEGQVQCGQPQDHFELFEGKLIFMEDHLPLKIDQLILRGSQIKHSQWVIGVACYTGNDTKIMLSYLSNNRVKQSRVEQMTNRTLLIIFLFQLTCCFVCMILAMVSSDGYLWYLRKGSHWFIGGLSQFFTYLVLTNTMIPISLIVSLQIVRYGQKYFIEKDGMMFDIGSRLGPQVFNSSVNEDLGQIQHVFIDKTGTLTQNRLLCGGLIIGNQVQSEKNIGKPLDKGVNFVLLDDNIMKMKALSSQNELNTLFWSCILILNEYGRMSQEITPPEDLVLSRYCRIQGYKVGQCKADQISIECRGVTKSYRMLMCLPFDGKQITVIVQNIQDQVIYVMTKGGDDHLKYQLSEGQPYSQRIRQQLKSFEEQGQRVLGVAFRIISNESWELIKNQKRKQTFNRNDIEDKFILIGAVGFEEMLQDSAASVLQSLRDAKIKSWILTGDKVGSTLGVAKQCRYITTAQKLLYYNGQIGIESNLKLFREQIAKLETVTRNCALIMEGEHLESILIDSVLSKHFLDIAMKCHSVLLCRLSPCQKGMIVEFVMKELNAITLAIGDGANDAIMIQKASVGVGISGSAESLAIQGADYVLPNFKGLWRLLFVHGRWSYIRTSEMILFFFYKNMMFSIVQFYHAFLCQYSGQSVFDEWYVAFYNTLFTAFPLLVRALLEQDIYYIQPKNDKNVQQVKKILKPTFIDEEATKDATTSTNFEYSDWVPSGHVENEKLKKLFPKLYYIGQKNQIFAYKRIGQFCLEGMLGGLIAFGLIWFQKGNKVTIQNGNGRTYEFWELTLTLYTTIILVVNIKLVMSTRFHTIAFIFSIAIFSLPIYIGYMFVVNSIPKISIYHIVSALAEQSDFYFILLACVSMTFLYEYTFSLIGYVKNETFQRLLVKSVKNGKLEQQHIKFEKMNSMGMVQDPVIHKYDDYNSDMEQCVD